jgi:hypothetical protein
MYSCDELSQANDSGSTWVTIQGLYLCCSICMYDRYCLIYLAAKSYSMDLE